MYYTQDLIEKIGVVLSTFRDQWNWNKYSPWMDHMMLMALYKQMLFGRLTIDIQSNYFVVQLFDPTERVTYRAWISLAWIYKMFRMYFRVSMSTLFCACFSMLFQMMFLMLIFFLNNFVEFGVTWWAASQCGYVEQLPSGVDYVYAFSKGECLNLNCIRPVWC